MGQMGTRRRLVAEAEAAEYLGTTKGTLRQDRHGGANLHIPFVRLGRAIRYDLAALEAYIQDHTVELTAEDDAA